jgi:hypothetical protein
VPTQHSTLTRQRLPPKKGKTVTTLNLPEPATANRISTEARPSIKRRSMRVVIDFPVSVFGQSSDGKIFAEKTKTVTVSAHGALITLKADIDSRKPILLANTKTGMQVQCRIPSRKDSKNGAFEVSLEFANPLPEFWGINFPPEDWNPAERKKATSPHRPISASAKG